MEKKINKDNVAPLKKYFYIIVAIIVCVFAIWYFYSWYTVSKAKRIADSFLISSNTISLELKNIKEVSSVLKETPSKYFVFISYTNSDEEYNLERKLKRLIDNYNIADKFYYLNVSDLIESNNLISTLNKTFNTDLISSVPCILYYEDDKLDYVIQNNKDIFDVKEFQELLDDLKQNDK